MRISVVSRVISLTVVALTVVTLYSAFMVNEQYARQAAVLEQRHETLKVMEMMIDGINKLTSLARAHAATAESWYRRDFEDEVKVLKTRDRAIQEMIALHITPEELGLLMSAKQSSDELMAIEFKAFEAGAQGRRDTAIGLVFGAEYQATKVRIWDSLEVAESLIEKRLQAEALKHTQQAQWARWVFVVSVSLTAFSTLLALLFFYQRRFISPLIKLAQKMQTLLAGEAADHKQYMQQDSEIGDLSRSIEDYRQQREVLDAERLSVEADLIRSQTRLERILEDCPAGVTILSKSGKPIFANTRMAEILKFNLKEFFTRRATEFWVTQEDRDNYIALFEKFNRVDGYETQLRCDDGSCIWVRISARPIEHDNKDYLLTWVFDISDSKRAEVELREQSAFLQVLIDTIQFPIFYKGADSRFISCNKAYESVFAQDRSELIGKSVLDLEFLSVEDRFLYQKEDEQLIKNSSSTYRTVEIPFADGELHEALYSASGFRKTDGSPGGLVGTFVDIAEQKAAERTMQAAKELAEDVSNMKSNFLANMSHEIRTPMNAIMGMCYLVLKTELSPKQQEYLEKIQMSSEHLLHVINDILDYSKIEAGKCTIESVAFEVSVIMRSLANMVQDKAQAKGLGFAINLSPNLPEWLQGDPFRIGQILINLVNNALKFTDRGSVTVAVEVNESDQHKTWLKFVIKDTGIGITQEQKQNLFQSFQQADASTTRRYGGTGLGLAISKNLVELMGGAIGVESYLGQGSTFWFQIPLHRAAQDAESLNQRNLAKQASTRENIEKTLLLMAGARILLAEDNRLNQIVAADILHDAGFIVDIADNGEVAVALAKARKYDLIFMDVQMPVLDGLSAARALRQIPALVNLPIIAMTANASHQDREKCLAAGMHDHLAKPIEVEQLWRVLAKWIKPRDLNSPGRAVADGK
jgi:PAS domain S-box-containing protein